jgi:hypothetical protein
MQARLAENQAVARADDFVARITAEVHRRGVQTLRIHVSGDFFDATYVEKWANIAGRCPRTTFYAYTRSWRVPSIVPALVALADRPNVRLWFSCDAETGLPIEIPARVRVAYLQTDRHEEPSGDLIFRVRPLRRLPTPHSTLSVLCPSEVTAPRPTHVTCTSCRLCHR